MKKIFTTFLFSLISLLVMAQYQWVSTPKSDILSEDVVFTKLFQDSQDNIWVGCSRSTLLKYDGTNWTILDNSTLNLDNTFEFINDIYEDPQGRIWVSTGGGIACFHNNNWTTYSQSNVLPYGYGYAFDAIYFNDKMYFSVFDGVLTYDESSWVYEEIEGGQWAPGLGIDSNDQLWIAFANGFPSFRLNGTTWEEFTTDNSDICFNFLYDMHLTGTGKLWFYGPNGSACMYDGTSFTSGADLGNWGITSSIYAIHSNGVSDDIWIATNFYGPGLAHRQNGVNTFYNETHGLLSSNLVDVFVANDGSIWVIGDEFIAKGNTTSSTEQVENSIALTVSPNPTTGEVYFNYETESLPTQFEVQVFHPDGRNLKTVQQDIYESLDLNEFSSGLYFLRLIFDEGFTADVKVFKR